MNTSNPRAKDQYRVPRIQFPVLHTQRPPMPPIHAHTDDVLLLDPPEETIHALLDRDLGYFWPNRG